MLGKKEEVNKSCVELKLVLFANTNKSEIGELRKQALRGQEIKRGDF